MKSKHVCPKCGGRTFSTCATVTQEWKVDENGDYLEVLEDCLQVFSEPDDGNIWACVSCGAEAILAT